MTDEKTGEISMSMVTTITKAAEVLKITERELAEKGELVVATELAQTYGRACRGMYSSDYDIKCDRQYIYLDQGEAHGQKYTWLNFVKAVRIVLNEGSALQAVQDGKLSALADIEARIHMHVQTAYASIIEVGRDLIDAKNSGLIPHGQWEAWVREHAQMSEGRAQRLMKIAREVAPDSRLAALPISKIQEILSLPEAQREQMAERAQAEDMTVKDLRAAVAREQAKSDQLMAKYNSAVNERRKKEAEVKDLQTILQRERDARQEARKSWERDHQYEIGELKKEIEAARASANGISPEAQREIDRLEAELQAAEEMADHQAQLRQQAQDALLQAQSQNARGSAPEQEDLTAFEVITAARTFISGVGYMPHSTKLAMLGAKDRQELISYVEMVAKWAEDMRDALDWSNVVVIGEA